MSNEAIKASDWYGEAFKTWAVKTHGPRVTNDQLALAHLFGRPGKQSLALAMALRPDGATGSQIMFACDGKPQNNHRTGLIQAGLFKRVAPMQAGDGHTVYKVELTAKGTKRVETLTQRAAEAAQRAEAEAEGDKPKAKPAKRTSTRRKPAKGKPEAEAPKAPTADRLPVVSPVDPANPDLPANLPVNEAPADSTGATA